MASLAPAHRRESALNETSSSIVLLKNSVTAGQGASGKRRYINLRRVPINRLWALSRPAGPRPIGISGVANPRRPEVDVVPLVEHLRCCFEPSVLDSDLNVVILNVSDPNPRVDVAFLNQLSLRIIEACLSRSVFYDL
jgi:hypothetical protein